MAFLYQNGQCKDDCQRKINRFIRNSGLISQGSRLWLRITATEIRESTWGFYPSSRPFSSCPNGNQTNYTVLMSCVVVPASARHTMVLIHTVRSLHISFSFSALSFPSKAALTTCQRGVILLKWSCFLFAWEWLSQRSGNRSKTVPFTAPLI